MPKEFWDYKAETIPLEELKGLQLKRLMVAAIICVLYGIYNKYFDKEERMPPVKENKTTKTREAKE